MASSRTFINPEAIRNSATAISGYNEQIKEKLGTFTSLVESVEWEALGASAMLESFNSVKPTFEDFYNYVVKIVNFLNQNVAEDAETLDAAIQGNAGELRPR